MAAGNVDGDTITDIVTGSGDQVTAQVRVYTGVSILTNPANPSTQNDPFDPFDEPASNGIYVG